MERLRSLHQFEIWRLNQVSRENFSTAALEAATKLGHLSKEGVLSRDQALEGIETILINRLSETDSKPEIESAFDRGLKEPAMAYLRYQV